MHTVHRCSLLLQTSHVVWYVCLCVGQMGGWAYCAKTSEPIKMPLGSKTHVGPRNHVSDWDQDRTNPFTAMRGEMTAMLSFANLLWTFVYVLTLKNFV